MGCGGHWSGCHEPSGTMVPLGWRDLPGAVRVTFGFLKQPCFGTAVQTGPRPARRPVRYGPVPGQ
jgi:hypothetical protein